MLFDLQGKRRRLVQGTYLTLAVLMGGGLVLFGIGSDVSGGGLFDAFSGGNQGGGSNNDAIEKRIDRNERRLRANPRSEAALKGLVRDHHALAGTKTSPGEKRISRDARRELAGAAVAWTRYVKLTDKPDASLANTALQVFDVGALNRPKEARDVTLILAEAASKAEKPGAYVRVVQYAALAGDKRSADLAGRKAVDVAPKDQKKAVRAQVPDAYVSVVRYATLAGDTRIADRAGRQAVEVAPKDRKKAVRAQVEQAKDPQAAGAAGGQGTAAGG